MLVTRLEFKLKEKKEELEATTKALDGALGRYDEVMKSSAAVIAPGLTRDLDRYDTAIKKWTPQKSASSGN